MTLSFGRKINYVPLIICISVSILVGGFLFLFSKQAPIGIMFGILCLIVSPLLYSLNLSRDYDCWQIDQRGIYYYDYSTTVKKVKAMLLPSEEHETVVRFDQIESFAIVVNKSMGLPAGFGPNGSIDASFYVVDTAMAAFSSPYYLALNLKNQTEVDLDLSTNAKDVTEIKEMIRELENQTQTNVKLLRSRV